MPDSTTPAKLGKVFKPYPTYPLFAHATGRWAKKIRGAFVYFGKVADDPKGEKALALWLEQRDDLLAGRKPRKPGDDRPTLADLCNRFLTAKLSLVQTGELTQRSFLDYRRMTDGVIAALGKNRLVADLRSDDFETLRKSLARTRGPVALGNEIARVRVLFKFGYDADLIDRPVKYGPHFKRPSKKTLRLARKEKGPRMLEAPELRRLIQMAGQPLGAMILLGINAGLGASDIARLRQSNLDLKGGWLDYPRPKTGIDRRVPLWPETVKSLETTLAMRPKPKVPDNDTLVFITKYGHPWARMSPDKKDNEGNVVKLGIPLDAIGQKFAKLLDDAGLKRRGLGFYALRHTLETVGGDAKDQVALDAIMGHARDDMASLYRERISNDRLRAVVEHVRGWLFGAKTQR